MTDFQTLRVSRSDAVATVQLISQARVSGEDANIHWDLGVVMNELRGDNSVRVVVLTGEADDEFLAPRPREAYVDAGVQDSYTDPPKTWRTFQGIARALEAMLQMEKPIVARVNGDAGGFGSSLVFACDFVVADEQAVVVDTHLGMGEPAFGSAYGIVPGDGGVLATSSMSPALAKEFLMLAQPYTGAELARMGVINRAVPRAELDAATEDYVERLLKRSAYALAWTKRIVNQPAVQHLAGQLNASMAYEMVGFLQLDKEGWEVRRSLE